jgi:16S rRNA pseudouridine516 synthase
MTKMMHLEDILYNQGFGTRRVCAGLIEKGLVEVYLESKLSAASVFIA